MSGNCGTQRGNGSPISINASHSLVNPGCGVTGQGCGGRHRAIRLGQSRFMGVSIGRVRAYAAIPRRAWEGRITTSAVQVNDLVNPGCGALLAAARYSVLAALRTAAGGFQLASRLQNAVG